MKQTVYADMPASKGMQNALLRAKQLANIRWTPIKPFPVIFSSGNGPETHKSFLKPFRPQTGLNYSAVGFTNEKYLGVNVSVETFMTALANPRSKLYTQPIFEKHRLSAAFYGTVCSEFASYVLGFPFQIDCGQLSVMEEMEHIDPSPLEKLELCDLLNEPKSHTAVITGIDRDENGKVVSVTVTESTPPQIQTKTFLPQEFVSYWLENGYEILRYKKLDKVTYTPDPWVHLEGDPELPAPVPNPILLPDYGDKANYRLGESVTLSVFDNAYTKILLQLDGQELVLPVEDGDVTFIPEKAGYYQAVAISETGKSQVSEFCVTDAAVTTDKESYENGESIRLSFTCAAGDELTGFMVKTDKSAKYWGYVADNGVLPDEITLPSGDYFIIAHYRNRFGVYSATPAPVFHVE